MWYTMPNEAKGSEAMKVCLLNDSFPPAIDGVVNVVMNYADHLGRDHGAECPLPGPAVFRSEDHRDCGSVLGSFLSLYA